MGEGELLNPVDQSADYEYSDCFAEEFILRCFWTNIITDKETIDLLAAFAVCGISSKTTCDSCRYNCHNTGGDGLWETYL
jgi:hypothetical protein